MNETTADVVIVGASATGSLAGREAAKRGASVLLLEEDSLPGKFHKCSGLYSKRGIEKLNVDYSGFFCNEIKGANIHAGKHSFTVQKKESIALVLDRQKLDEALCQQAIDAGAKLQTSQKIMRKNENGIASQNSMFGFRYLIGADGVSSTVAHLYNFPSIGNGNIAMCYEAEFDNCNIENPELVDVFLDRKIFPGFFGWIIPSGGKKARIGFGTTKHAALKIAFNSFFALPQVQQVRGDKTLRDFWHAIPLRTRKVTQKQNVLLVGDAAGQVKSTSGGGVVFGGQCAMLAGEIAARNCNGENLNYEAAWRKKFGKVLKTHRAIRKIFDAVPTPLHKLTVFGFDKLFVSKLVEKFGDMDYIASVK